MSQVSIQDRPPSRAFVRATLVGKVDALRSRGVAALYLFGSVGRGTARSDSDIDLFMDLTPGHPFSLIDLVSVQHALEELLRCRVDLTTRAGLHPMLKDRIVAEAERVL